MKKKKSYAINSQKLTETGVAILYAFKKPTFGFTSRDWPRLA